MAGIHSKTFEWLHPFAGSCGWHSKEDIASTLKKTLPFRISIYEEEGYLKLKDTSIVSRRYSPQVPTLERRWSSSFYNNQQWGGMGAKLLWLAWERDAGAQVVQVFWSTSEFIQMYVPEVVWNSDSESGL